MRGWELWSERELVDPVTTCFYTEPDGSQGEIQCREGTGFDSAFHRIPLAAVERAEGMSPTLVVLQHQCAVGDSAPPPTPLLRALKGTGFRL